MVHSAIDCIYADGKPGQNACSAIAKNHQDPLHDPLRSGVSNEELIVHIRIAVALKPERHEFKERLEQIVQFMPSKGG
ncbi:MAG: hypothetical protein KZQ80_17400 [Candidatus Thiodiazotropha sp. (ex Monitilora ramsayi)]|nr:hypothetical protein [Candidatus Thiodiazotropha sp. (ex Monitilora ramsayi)]